MKIGWRIVVVCPIRGLTEWNESAKSYQQSKSRKPQEPYETLCPSNYQNVFGTAEDRGCTRAWSSGVTFGHVRWGQLPGRFPSTLRLRIHFEAGRCAQGA